MLLPQISYRKTYTVAQDGEHPNLVIQVGYLLRIVHVRELGQYRDVHGKVFYRERHQFVCLIFCQVNAGGSRMIYVLEHLLYTAK